MTNETVLVTGGAGYIGSHMTKVLLDGGNQVIVADNLERGFEGAVDKRANLEVGDLRDKNYVSYLFSQYDIDAVIHFAAYIAVGESMQRPSIYFENNFLSALNLVEEMRKRDQNNFIFSSTAAVYGNPDRTPIPEDHTKRPTNPYGESKLMVEKMLSWYQEVKGLNYVALRYFNASGASLDATLGEQHDPETHLIPNAIRAALTGSVFKLFGDDYDTPDGSCVRDYIHVLDLAQAHILALEKLQKDPGGYVYNVGTGTGYSNKEVVDTVKKATGKDFEVAIESRREGDPAKLIADPTKINTDLDFKPQYSDLDTIVKTALAWHKKKLS